MKKLNELYKLECQLSETQYRIRWEEMYGENSGWYEDPFYGWQSTITELDYLYKEEEDLRDKLFAKRRELYSK